MDINAFVEGFAQQFMDTDPSEITASTRFHALEEWSSLTALCVIGFVRTECGKTITARELKDIDTVQDLYDLVQTL